MYLRSGPYQEVLQGILVSLQLDEGIIKITGKGGAGKSALCKQLHDALRANGQPAVLFPEPPASATALQDAIIGELQLNATGNFTRTLSAWLHARDAVSKPLVLIVDDAQKLDPTTFSALRMLCNIQDNAHSLVRIVLCGNDELDRRLGSPALRAVTQFISHSFALPYLTLGQVGDFCQAYALQSGGDIKPLTERALLKLHHDTKGKPGLLYARLEEQNAVAEPVVARIPDAATLLALGDVKDEHKPPRHRMFVLVTVVLLAGATAAWLYLLQPPRSAEATVPADSMAPPPADPEPVAAIAPLEEALVEEAMVEEAMVDETPVALAEEPLRDTASSEDEVAETLADVPDLAPEVDVAAEAVVEEPAVGAADANAVSTATAPTIEGFIASWIAGWQAQDIDAYLAHYHPAFMPVLGTREAWEQQRRRVIGTATGIAIAVEPLQSDVDGPQDARVVRFWLEYRAANYADRTLKELTLAQVDGEWRIRAERSLVTEPL